MKIVQIILFLTILFAPLYIIRSYFIWPQTELFVPFTLLEVMILFSVSLTAVIFIHGKYSISLFRTSLDLWIGLFLVSAIIAVFTSYDFIGGLGILKAYFIEPILFYYCLIFAARLKGYKFIILALIGAGIWISALAILQKFFGLLIFAPVEYEQNRITAVFNSANSLALFLGPLALLTFSRYFASSHKNYFKYLYFICFALFLFIIYLTRSRGGMISLVGALSVFTFAILTIKSGFLRKIWFTVPLAVFLILAGFFITFYQNYDFFQIDHNRPYTEGDTLQIRYFIWAGTVNMLKDHFVFGAGLNGFKTLYSNQYRPVQYQEQFQYPHNFLLTVWSEMGIFGLFCFLLLIISLYGILIRNLIKSHQPVLGAAFLGILSYWMLHGMVDVPYFKNDLSLEFWTVAALIEAWRLRG